MAPVGRSWLRWIASGSDPHLGPRAERIEREEKRIDGVGDWSVGGVHGVSFVSYLGSWFEM